MRERLWMEGRQEGRKSYAAFTAVKAPSKSRWFQCGVKLDACKGKKGGKDSGTGGFKGIHAKEKVKECFLPKVEEVTGKVKVEASEATKVQEELQRTR